MMMMMMMMITWPLICDMASFVPLCIDLVCVCVCVCMCV